MKLRRLAIRRLPGIPGPGFEIDRLGGGVNVVHGPNASGKTSISRAVRAVLYDSELARESVHVEAVFAVGSEEEIIEAARTGSTVTWTRDGQRIEAPPLPEHRFLHCYTLHIEDLLSIETDTDAEIARHILRELAGGYDLEAARRECGFVVPPQIGRTEARELEGAEAALRKIQRRQQELRREEDGLATIERRRREAEDAGREAALVDQARRLLEKRRERIGLERRRDALPPDMHRLVGDEVERLEDLRKARRETAGSLARADAELRRAERSLDETGLAGGGPDQASIAEVRLRLDRLRELEGDLRRERSAEAAAEGTRKRAVEELGGKSEERAHVEPETIRVVERGLEESRRLAAEVRGTEAELSGLPDPETTGTWTNPSGNPERLRDARHELLRWLSASVPPAFGTLRLTALLVLIAAAAAGAIALGQLVHPGGLALLVPAGAAALWLLLRRDAGLNQRREAERRYRTLGLDRPDNWEISRVEARLFELDGELVDARRRVEEIRRRREVEKKRETLATDLEEERSRLAAIARKVNFDPLVLDAPFHRWLRLTEQYDLACNALEESRSRLEALQGEARGVRAGVVSFLAEHGEGLDGGDSEIGESGAGTSASESAFLVQRLDRVSDRGRRCDEAQRDIGAARESRDRFAGEIRSRDAAVEALYRNIGLEPSDEAELRRRLGHLEEWRSLDQQLSRVHVEEDLLRSGIGPRLDLLSAVEEDDEAELDRRHGTLGEKAARAADLADEIARIRNLVDRTMHERVLEDARTRRQRAEDALRGRYDEAMRADAGAFLLEQVESEHVRTSRPAVLRRAEEWFARFTRHQYRLEVGAEGVGAREIGTADGTRRSLSELSSGTRMQLLLAIRIAFAMEAERGRTPLPLFLDEALTTADPERFQAAADSLRRFAEEEGRQIFYLTAQPDELRYWAEAAPDVIDLAECRRAGRTVARPAEVELPPAAAQPPRPDGVAAEEYAVRIGAAPVEPWEPASAVHLFHLLRDDLELLWRFLRTGIDRLGPLASLLASGEASLLVPEDGQLLLRLRAAGAEAWIEAWRVGRGRPVDRNVLDASGAVSPVFSDRMAALAHEADGDARRLLHAVDTGAVPRFWDRNRGRLEEWFRENGYLEDAPALDQPALERRVAAAFSAHGAPDELALDEAAKLARSMAAGLPGRRDAA